MRPQVWRAVCPSKDMSTSPLLTPLQHHQLDWLMFLEGVLHTITRLSHDCAHCEPAVIHRENRAPMENWPNLVFSSKCQSGCTVMGCEHRGLTCGCAALMPSPCSRSRQKHAGEAPPPPFVGFRDCSFCSSLREMKQNHLDDASTMVLCASPGFLAFSLGVW